MNHLLNKDNRVRIYKQDRLETKLILDWPLSSIISSEIKLCTLNLPMFIWTFIDKSQNGPALRYFSSHVCESKSKIDKFQDGPALWYFASLCSRIEMQTSDSYLRKSEAELAYALSKIIIAKNSFPDRVSVLLLIWSTCWKLWNVQNCLPF